MMFIEVLTESVDKALEPNSFTLESWLKEQELV
jgi:hypothetical protein